jgi:ribonucleoside-diphosphate reductase beta chain
MVATSTMINYINRDEQIHVDLFVKIFKEVLAENPKYDTPELAEFAVQTFRKAAELEIEWAEQIIGTKITGITMKEITEYIQFTANIRCNQMGFGKRLVFPDAPTGNPLRWIKAYEDVDLGKTDFFEQKSRQYTKTNNDNGFDDL